MKLSAFYLTNAWIKKKKKQIPHPQAGSINALQCYYARGEDNENFQRRCYWMLEEELSNIIFVHYLEVTGNRTNFNCGKETEAAPPYSLGNGESMFLG